MMKVNVFSSDDDSQDTRHLEIIKAYTEIENYKKKRINFDEDVINY